MSRRSKLPCDNHVPKEHAGALVERSHGLDAGRYYRILMTA